MSKIYEAEYKCAIKYYTIFEFPTLKVKYKARGAMLWKRRSEPIDKFARLFWKKEYYDIKFNEFDIHWRLTTLKRIINERYNGKFDDYVAMAVKYWVMENAANKEEEREAAALMKEFVTHGWKAITVEIEGETTSE